MTRTGMLTQRRLSYLLRNRCGAAIGIIAALIGTAASRAGSGGAPPGGPP